MTVSAGDGILSIVYSSSSTYYTEVYDLTTNKVCTSSYNMSMGSSYYAEFIGETPWYGSPLNYYARLPEFVDVPSNSYTVLLSSGDINGNPMFSYAPSPYQSIMINGGVLNIQNSYISSNSFSETWLSSANT